MVVPKGHIHPQKTLPKKIVRRIKKKAPKKKRETISLLVRIKEKKIKGSK
jgi:hypothetical protein